MNLLLLDIHLCLVLLHALPRQKNSSLIHLDTTPICCSRTFMFSINVKLPMPWAPTHPYTIIDDGF